MPFWKWGVHFGGMHIPNHYEGLLDNGMVIGRVDQTPYEELASTINAISF